MPGLVAAAPAMEPVDPSLYIDKLDAYVRHEKNVATYKWLSREMGIPVNLAKQMLYAYSVSAARDGQAVHCTFALGGWLPVSKGSTEKVHQIVLVDDEHVEAAKQRFDPLTFVHVYSVEPGVPKDLKSVLYNSEVDADAELVCRAKADADPIVCAEVERRQPQARKVAPAAAQPPAAAKIKQTTSAPLPAKTAPQPSKPVDKKVESFFGKSAAASKAAAAPKAAVKSPTKGKQQSSLSFQKEEKASVKAAPAARPKEDRAAPPAPADKPSASGKRRKVVISDDEDDEEAASSAKPSSKARRIIDDDEEDDDEAEAEVADVVDEVKVATPAKRPREEITPEPAAETPGCNVAPPETVQEGPADAEPADSADDEHDAKRVRVTEEAAADIEEQPQQQMDAEAGLDEEEFDPEELAALADVDWDDTSLDGLGAKKSKAKAAAKPPAAKKKPEKKPEAEAPPAPPPKPMHVPAGKRLVEKTYLNGSYMETRFELEDDPDYVAPPPKAAPAKNPTPPKKPVGKGAAAGKKDGKGTQKSITSFFKR